MEWLANMARESPRALQLVALAMTMSMGTTLAALAMRSQRRALSTVAVIGAALAVAGAFSVVRHARADFVASLLSPWGEAFWNRAIPVAHLVYGQLVAFFGLAVVLPSSVVARGLSFEGRPRAVTLATAAWIAVVGGVGLAFALDVDFGLRSGRHETLGYLYHLDAADQRLQAWRWAAVAVAVAVPGAALATSRRAPRLGWGATAAAALAFVAACGLAASTRSMAADAAHPVSLELGWHEPDDCGVRAPDLPASTRVPLIGPSLAICSSGEVRLDGRTMRSVDDLRQDLGTLRRNWAILHPREPFVGQIRVWIGADAPASTFAPYVAAASEGEWSAVLAAQHVEPLPTATLGTLERLDGRVYAMPSMAGARTGRDLLWAATAPH
ncbi:MAG: hypothetical protein H6719_10190 [Sandaracinaceae bacterium]|nr:hypothetical protein [Sandaracinaceae bacterium]